MTVLNTADTERGYSPAVGGGIPSFSLINTEIRARLLKIDFHVPALSGLEIGLVLWYNSIGKISSYYCIDAPMGPEERP